MPRIYIKLLKTFYFSNFKENFLFIFFHLFYLFLFNLRKVQQTQKNLNHISNFFSSRRDQKSMKYLPKKNKVKLPIQIVPYIYQYLHIFVINCKVARAYLNNIYDDYYTVSTQKRPKLLDIKQIKANRMLILGNCPNL